ncbi:MAG: SO_0444 family Cu/Zn efflux transporter, partial [bacterium]|nr:SO_0444 family Cu/Zn efflux transporter [bacterium]
NFLSVIKASVLGVPIPLCSCGVIPTALSLRKNKASKGAVISFLISTPQTGVDSILATYGMMGPVFAVFRPIVSFVMGVAGGVAINIFCKEDSHIKENKHQEEYCYQCKNEQLTTDSKPSLLKKLKEAVNYAYFEFLDDISVNLITGIIIAGIISFFIPEDFFAEYINNEFLSMLLMIVAGIPLYICATSSIPVAVALMIKGISPGAAFVFLAVGPATNAAAITVIIKEMGKKVLIIYLTVIVICSLFAGYILNIILDDANVSSFLSSDHIHHGNGGILIQSITLLFIVFLALSIKRVVVSKIKKKAVSYE